MLFNVAAVLALVGASQAVITITNFDVVGNSTSSIKWASSDIDNDPVSFTIELTNPSFHTQFAVGNNVQTTDGAITFETPALQPGPNYGIQFVANNNASDILAQTNPFSIDEHDVTSSTVSSFSGTTTISAVRGTSGLPASTTGAGASPSGTTSGFGTTVANTGSGTGTPTGTSSSPSGTASVFNSGGGGSNNAGVKLDLKSGVVVGAVMAGLTALMA